MTKPAPSQEEYGRKFAAMLVCAGAYLHGLELKPGVGNRFRWSRLGADTLAVDDAETGERREISIHDRRWETFNRHPMLAPPIGNLTEVLKDCVYSLPGGPVIN